MEIRNGKTYRELEGWIRSSIDLGR
jgi:hypothetical protein